MRRLGVTVLENGVVSAPWQHTDMSEKVRHQFGRMTGLWRVHYGLAKLLSLAEAQQTEVLTASIVQMLKATHQVAIDGGGWANASLLLPWADPLAKELWAGEDEEMAMTAKYNRNMKNLSVRVQALVDGDGPPAVPTTAGQAHGEAKGTGKGRNGARRAAAAARKNAEEDI